VLTRLVPITLDDVPVFPSNHAVIALDPMQDYTWQTIQLPHTWLEHGYYVELWDATNKPIPGFRATKLITDTIDISNIDASLTPSLRLVIFQPPNTPPPPTDYAVYITYQEYPNQRLFVLLSIALMMLWTIIFWTLIRTRTVHVSLMTGSLSPYLATISTILFGGIFGAVLGSFIGGIQILYVLIKLPFLLGTTLLISFSTLVVLSWLSGVKASLKEIWTVSLNLLAITTLGLCSFSLILGFYILYPLNHDQVLIATIIFFIASGGLALLSLYRWQHTIILPVVWITVYGLVFLQLGWMLRPWVGVIDPVHATVPIARANSGNVFTELIHTMERITDP